MAIVNTLKKAAHMLPLVFTLAAANANAADTLEIDQLDLSKPLPTGCFVDNEKGTATDKLLAAMGARRQTTVVYGNQVVEDNANPYRALRYTSTLQQGGEGYKIRSDAALNNPAHKHCIAYNQKVYVYSVFNSHGVPSIVNLGEMGKALTNNDKAGIKVALTILTDVGSIAAVNFNPNTGKGSEKSADGNGNTAADTAYMVDTQYYPKLPQEVKAALGIPH